MAVQALSRRREVPTSFGEAEKKDEPTGADLSRLRSPGGHENGVGNGLNESWKEDQPPAHLSVAQQKLQGPPFWSHILRETGVSHPIAGRRVGSISPTSPPRSGFRQETPHRREEVLGRRPQSPWPQMNSLSDPAERWLRAGQPCGWLSWLRVPGGTS